jgi:hypothetical protein
VTIGKLSNKVLLKIFRYHLDVSPRLWPRLVHICCRWRRIVLASQRALHLQLFCTHGTSVLKALDYWLALPIVVNFGGSPALDPLAPEDEANITAALKQSGRVTSICLTVTGSLLEMFSEVEGSFLKLEDLVLLSRDSMQLTLPSTFRCGPRLRSLHLTRVSFPALTRLLYSSKNLVDLRLHEVTVLNTWHISPATLANALSRMAQLQSLSLHFPSTINSITSHFTSGDRVILPSLTCLNLQGIDAYSEGLVARIDAPSLRCIEITFFEKRIFDVPQLREFINRIEVHKSHRQADILSSVGAISISLTRPGAPSCLKLRVFCKTLRSQPFFMAQICSHFSASLSRVEDLRISSALSSPVQDSGNRGQWLRIIRRFGGTKWFHLAGELSTEVVRALQLSEARRETALPVLHKLCIREPESPSTPLREEVVSFMHSCRLSGRFIVVVHERLISALSTNGPGSGTTFG